MKRILFILGLLSVGVIGGLGQEEKKTEPKTANENPPAKSEKTASKILSQDELEAKFKALLTNATLKGRWSPIQSAELGPEKQEDQYFIVSANKLENDKWVINAKMEYGKTEMTIPVPVRVQWSGDTPVIIVDEFSMGGKRSYTARVLFFNDTYAGSWYGSNGYGGLLYGSVTHQPQTATKAAQPEAVEKK
jgi:hypothetical protein